MISAAEPSLTTATASILQHQRLVAGRTDIGSTYLFHIRYSRHWYLMLKSLSDAGKTTWTKHIKSILFEYGFGYAWIENEVGNSTHFSNSFKQRIKDISIQNLHQSITNSSKATNYKHFKSNLDVEKYLSNDLNFVSWKTLANFRCSGHNHLIEKGRHLNIEREYKFCRLVLKEMYLLLKMNSICSCYVLCILIYGKILKA